MRLWVWLMPGPSEVWLRDLGVPLLRGLDALGSVGGF